MSSVYLSVIVPTFNEAERIVPTLNELKKYLSKKKKGYEVIVSDDGSTDATVAIVKKYCSSWPQCRVLSTHKPNQGKGDAVKRGVMASTGEIVLFTDADNAVPIAQLSHLESWLKDFPMVVGSKYASGAKSHDNSSQRAFLSKMSNWLVRVTAVPNVLDTQCGFKLFRRKEAQQIFKRVTVHGFGFDIELFVIAKVLKIPFKEVGVEWYANEGSRVHPVRDAIKTLLELVSIIRKQHQHYYH